MAKGVQRVSAWAPWPRPFLDMDLTVARGTVAWLATGLSDRTKGFRKNLKGMKRGCSSNAPSTPRVCRLLQRAEASPPWSGKGPAPGFNHLGASWVPRPPRPVRVRGSARAHRSGQCHPGGGTRWPVCHMLLRRRPGRQDQGTHPGAPATEDSGSHARG